MFVMGNFVIAIAKMVDVVLSIMYWLLLIRVLISWVNPDPFNPIVRFLSSATEPVLEPLRRLLPVMAIDLSPLVAFLALIFLRSFLVRTLFALGMRLQ